MRKTVHWTLLSRAACDPAERPATDEIEAQLNAAGIAFSHLDEALAPGEPSPVLLTDTQRLEGWADIAAFLGRLGQTDAHGDELLPSPLTPPTQERGETSRVFCTLTLPNGGLVRQLAEEARRDKRGKG